MNTTQGMDAASSTVGLGVGRAMTQWIRDVMTWDVLVMPTTATLTTPGGRCESGTSAT